MTDYKYSFWNKTVSVNDTTNSLTVKSYNGQSKSVTMTQDCFPADFHEADVRGIDFSKFEIQNSNFVGAKLVDCNFSGCDLMGVSFFGAELINCIFTGAKICANGPVSWHTMFPDDVSSCVFDDEGLKKLAELGKISADGKKRAANWIKQHPIREQWVPGGKLDSPWN